MSLIIGKFNCKYKTCYKVFPVLFRIFYGCGLRISEALNLKVKDVDLENGIIAVYESKNNNDRLVPLSNNLKNILTDYQTKCTKVHMMKITSFILKIVKHLS